MTCPLCEDTDEECICSPSDLRDELTQTRGRVIVLESTLAQIAREASDSPGNAKWPGACGKPIGSPCLRPKGHEGKCR